MTEEHRSVRDRYLEQMVESASPEGLVMMLVEGAVNFIRRAMIAHEKERYDELNTNLIKAQNIYLELVLSLDLDAGEFADNLALVYQFIYNLLIEANMEKDIEKMKQGLKVAEQIRDLWKETIEKANEGGEIKVSVENLPDSVDPSQKVKTGVYEPSGDRKIVESEGTAEDAPSRLNLTG
jgi:flagellar protein FliS